jgi:glycogen operon protein
MGATLDAQGTNFAVYSASATAGSISLCLYSVDSTETRVPLAARTGDIWHAYIPGIVAGQRYGYRLNGPWNPGAGLWGNEAKLLADPWSLAFDSAWDGDPAATTHAPRRAPTRA